MSNPVQEETTKVIEDPIEPASTSEMKLVSNTVSKASLSDRKRKASPNEKKFLDIYKHKQNEIPLYQAHL